MQGSINREEPGKYEDKNKPLQLKKKREQKRVGRYLAWKYVIHQCCLYLQGKENH